MTARAKNQARWYPSGRSKDAQATVAAGVDFLAEEDRAGAWRLSFWNDQMGAMEPIRPFKSFSELREYVDLQAPKYARFNRHAKQSSGRTGNEPDDAEPNRGVPPEEKEKRREREERGEKAKERRKRARHPNPLGTLEQLPKAARMWEAVYDSAQERGYSEERSAQQAWGAVKRAGYRQEDGIWKAPMAQNGPGCGCTGPVANGNGNEAELMAIRSPTLRVVPRKDGHWVVGQGLAVPVASNAEGNRLVSALGRASNPSAMTAVKFDSIDDLAHGLKVMDVANRRSRFDPTVFWVDWKNRKVILEGRREDPGVSTALASLDYAKIPFEHARQPNNGSAGRAAGYAVVGVLVGSALGFGLGALLGAAAGALVGGGAGAVVGATVGGVLGSYGGQIYGAAKGAAEGAPSGAEEDAAWGGGIGAALPFFGLFTAPLGAFLAVDAE